jgi:peptide/nickel transport system substrate-binding protein
MKQPNGDFPILNTWGFQLSPAVIKQYPAAEVGRYPVGTGPFRLADRQEGRAAFERFDGYWNGAPYLDKVVFRFYPDNATASAALESGDVDVMTGAPIEVVSRLGDRFKRMPWSSHFTAFAALNLRHPFTKDVRVRQALNYAVDREKLAKELYKGLVTVARGIASPTFPSWNSSLEPYPFDPERAKKLLADAGFGSGTTVRALLPTTAGAFPLLLELAQSVQADLRKVRVTVNHDVLEPNALTREIAKGLSADHVYHWGSLGGATPSNLELLFGKRFQPPNGINRGWYENEQVEKLFDQARGELDLAKRNRLYQQADEILKTDAAALFTIIYPTYALHAPKVVGLADRFFFMDFSKAWLSQ